MKKDDFQYLLQLLKEYAGWIFTEDKYFIVDKKIYNFVREKGYASVEELIADLKLGQKVLVWQVVEALAMSDTSFYRDYNVFKGFENHILPQIRETNRGSKKFRIWSIGCSSGQEAYSIAFAIKKKLLNVGDWDIKITGTDISTFAIQKAQKGGYTQFEVQMGLNARMIIDNFHQEKGLWQVNDDIMELLEFRRYNLLEDLTYSDKYDIVFCRNVLRFFDAQEQKKVIEKIYNKQTESGFLYLGMDEKVSGLNEFYTKVNGLPCLYQAKTLQTSAKPENTTSIAESKNTEQSVSAADEMPSFKRPATLAYKHPVISDVLKK